MDPQPFVFDELDIEYELAGGFAVSLSDPPGTPGNKVVVSQLDTDKHLWLCTEMDAPMLRSVISSLQNHLKDLEG